MDGEVTKRWRWRPRAWRNFSWPQALRLAIAIAAVQAVFWLVVYGSLFPRGHNKFTEFATSEFTVARVASGSDAALTEAEFQSIEVPGWYGCCEPGYWAVRLQVDIPEVPATGLGFLPMVSADNFEVRINGKLVVKRGSIELAHPTYHANENRIEFISPSAVRAGKNLVEYIMVRDAMPYTDFLGPVFGEKGQIDKAYGRQAFMLGPFEMICIVAGFLLSAFALVVLLQAESKGLPLALFLLTLAWTLKAHFYTWSEPPFGGMVRLYYYFMLTALVPIAWLNFADQWTGKPLRWLKWVCVGFVALAAGLFAFCLWGLPADQGFDLAGDVVNYGGILLIGLTLARLGWHVVRHGENRNWELGLFVLLVLLAAMEFVYDIFWQESTTFLTRSMPLLILSMTVAVFARSIRLFRSADQINQVLSQRLDKRERELADAYSRERDLVRSQAHGEERQRILRDMHDGLGSQLMSMLLAARRGEARAEQVAEGLQSVIDEMRLMIASMDSVGESLFAALSLFRDRMSQRVGSAGFSLEWTNTYGTDFPEYGPRPTLQVFRILQEAVTNALKHSGGTVIRIAIEPRPAGAGGVRVKVSDNGAASRTAAPDLTGPGRGLANMRTRAASIGASLSIEQGAEGLCVVLDLPEPVATETAAQAAE